MRAGSVARVGPLFGSLVMVVMSVAMFGVARQVVETQEDRLLQERTREVQAFLTSSIREISSTLQVLGALGSLQDANAARLFARSAAPAIEGNTMGIGVAAQRGDGFAVVANAGETPAVGTRLYGEIAGLLARAREAGQLVSARVADGLSRRLVLAQPTAGARNAVAYQVTRIQPDIPVPRAPGSPFQDLRIALYAAPEVDPSQLVLSTERRVPLQGEVNRVPFMIGADQWLLGVAARQPLVGSFARAAPWILLGAGLLATASAAAIMYTLARRRTYAEKAVAERTRDLDETRALLERLAAAAPVVVRRFDLANSRPTYISPNVQRIFGLSPEDSRRLPFGEHIHPDDHSSFEAAYRSVADGTTPRATVEYRTVVGATPRWVSAKIVPERDGDGAITAVISYALDIEDRKEAERAQREAQEAADAASRAKSEFLSRMSHELRTPLNAVLGFAQLLEMDLPEEHQDSVHQIRRAGAHLLDLINEVLDISRIEAGRLSLSPEPVSVAELLAETAELMDPIAAARKVEIRTDVSACDCHVRADRQRTKQVLLNLLSNAVKYNNPHGWVSISCTQPDPDSVSIEVRDTGIGVAPDDLSRLFVPFERLGAAQTDIEGSGVGLALSQRLAEAMEGRIDVSSAVGAGSAFTLTLPAAEAPTLTPSTTGRLVRQRVSEPRRVRRVISVEDNLANSQLLDRIIERRPGWRVEHAGFGQLGLDLARADPPDLILLDLHLPDMHGVEVLRRLKAMPATADVPVAILSADATPGQAERLGGLGAVAYLTKPLDIGAALELLDEVEAQSDGAR